MSEAYFLNLQSLLLSRKNFKMVGETINVPWMVHTRASVTYFFTMITIILGKWFIWTCEILGKFSNNCNHTIFKLISIIADFFKLFSIIADHTLPIFFPKFPTSSMQNHELNHSKFFTSTSANARFNSLSFTSNSILRICDVTRYLRMFQRMCSFDRKTRKGGRVETGRIGRKLRTVSGSPGAYNSTGASHRLDKTRNYREECGKIMPLKKSEERPTFLLK